MNFASEFGGDKNVHPIPWLLDHSLPEGTSETAEVTELDGLMI